MADEKQLAILTGGVDAWNEWRRNNPDLIIDLSKANLRGTDLSRASLNHANLHNADLYFANLRNTYLGGADLSRAILVGAVLFGAKLSGADLSGAVFGSTNLGFLCLKDVKGLESTFHAGRSEVGVETLALSNGRTPEGFLRACGLKDWEIAAAQLHRPDLSSAEITEITYRIHNLRAGQPLQFHTCFISYAYEDEQFARQLNDDLQAKGVRCWFAPHEMLPGRKINEQIDEAIQYHDKLLLILSPASLTSDWMRFEILRARKREVREKRQLLFPISLMPFKELQAWECFDADTATDLAAEIRSYYIPDFHESRRYQRGFAGLLKALEKSRAADSTAV